jgi:hypothetical protein
MKNLNVTVAARIALSLVLTSFLVLSTAIASDAQMDVRRQLISQARAQGSTGLQGTSTPAAGAQTPTPAVVAGDVSTPGSTLLDTPLTITPVATPAVSAPAEPISAPAPTSIATQPVTQAATPVVTPVVAPAETPVVTTANPAVSTVTQNTPVVTASTNTPTATAQPQAIPTPVIAAPVNISTPAIATPSAPAITNASIANTPAIAAPVVTPAIAPVITPSVSSIPTQAPVIASPVAPISAPAITAPNTPVIANTPVSNTAAIAIPQAPVSTIQAPAAPVTPAVATPISAPINNITSAMPIAAPVNQPAQINSIQREQSAIPIVSTTASTNAPSRPTTGTQSLSDWRPSMAPKIADAYEVPAQNYAPPLQNQNPRTAIGSAVNLIARVPDNYSPYGVAFDQTNAFPAQETTQAFDLNDRIQNLYTTMEIAKNAQQVSGQLYDAETYASFGASLVNIFNEAVTTDSFMKQLLHAATTTPLLNADQQAYVQNVMIPNLDQIDTTTKPIKSIKGSHKATRAGKMPKNPTASSPAAKTTTPGTKKKKKKAKKSGTATTVDTQGHVTTITTTPDTITAITTPSKDNAVNTNPGKKSAKRNKKKKAKKAKPAAVPLENVAATR